MRKIDCYDLSRREWEQIIDDWVFNERDRRLIKRRLLDGVCFEPLSEEFDLSVQQTKNIVYKTTERLLRHI